VNPIWILGLLAVIFVIQESFGEQPDQSEWKIEQLIGKYHDNEPKKDDDIFLIYYKLSDGNVTIGTLGSEATFNGFIFDVETQQADNLEIKIPRNYPSTNTGDFEGVFFFVNGDEYGDYVLEKTDCFSHYSIRANGKLEIYIVPGHHPASLPFRGESVPQHCLVKTLLLPPKQQIDNGILIEDVMCKKELKLMIKISNDTSACVTLSSAEKLIERGWGYLPN